MTQGVADLLRRAAGHRRSGDPPTYQRQYLAHAPGSAAPQFSGLSGVAGIAIDLVADVTGTLALDALSRRAEKMKAEAGPQGVSAGLEAAFAGQPMPRATNEMSAGARAYDNGAATGYAAALANRAKAGLSEIAIRNEANPDGFAQEAETFRREFDFVPRQLSPDFDLIWREAHEPLRLNLEKGRADRAAEVNGLELRTLLDDTNREISVVARGGDLGRARELTQRHEATLAAAVADGSLSAVQADEFRRRRDGTLREHSVMGRFDDAIADGIGPAQAYRDWFGANFGEMGLSADERDELDARMAALINHAEAEADRSQRLAEAAAREAQTRLGHDVESLVRVGAITGELPAGWGAAKAAADKVAPDLAAGMRRFEDGMTWRANYRKLPPDEQRAEIERLQAAATAAGDGSPKAAEALAELAKEARDTHGKTLDAAKKQPLGTAEALGVVEQTPLDPTRPETFAARARSVDATGRHFGLRQVAPFKDEELTAITDRIAADPDVRGKLAIARGFVMSWPTPERQREALDQLVTEGKLPKAYATALDIPGQAKAEAVLGGLLAGDKPADETDARDVAREARATYDTGRGQVLGAAAARNPLIGDMRKGEVEDLVALAQSRAAHGIADPVGSALADLFGHEREIHEPGLAHLVVPTNVDAENLRRGLRRLRQDGAAMLNDLPLPDAADPGEARMSRAIRARSVDNLRRQGVWIQSGDGLALILPGTAAPLTTPDGKPWIVTLDQALAIGAQEPPAAAAHASMYPELQAAETPPRPLFVP